MGKNGALETIKADLVQMALVQEMKWISVDSQLFRSSGLCPRPLTSLGSMEKGYRHITWLKHVERIR